MTSKHLYAEFTALAGSEDRVAELVADYVTDVRSEVGCLVFDPFLRADDERRWVVIEAYADDAAFEQHLAAEHNRRFNAAVADHIEGGVSSLVWLKPAATGR